MSRRVGNPAVILARALRRDRVLLVFYAIGIAVGVREYLVQRGAEEETWEPGCQASAASCFSLSAGTAPAADPEFWKRHADLTDIVSRLNPDDPDTDFLKAMQALADGDEEAFSRMVDEALATGAKHNDMLLQYHAQYLLNTGADWKTVNEAVNRWRENHPFSAEPLTLRLGAGPRTRSDAAWLQSELENISWVGGVQLQHTREETGESWQVLLRFRPGRTVDMREAVAAVTSLSIPEADRPDYRVVCSTLRDCTAKRR